MHVFFFLDNTKDRSDPRGAGPVVIAAFATIVNSALQV